MFTFAIDVRIRYFVNNHWLQSFLSSINLAFYTVGLTAVISSMALVLLLALLNKVSNRQKRETRGDYGGYTYIHISAFNHLSAQDVINALILTQVLTISMAGANIRDEND